MFLIIVFWVSYAVPDLFKVQVYHPLPVWPNHKDENVNVGSNKAFKLAQSS
jgi:hypothetical protein